MKQLINSFGDLKDYAAHIDYKYAVDPSPYYSYNLLESRNQLHVNGFTIIPAVLPSSTIEIINHLFYEYVLPSRSIFRRMSGEYELNKLDQHGHLLNPLSNIQLQGSRSFNRYINQYISVLINVLTEFWHTSVCRYFFNTERVNLLTWNQIHYSPGTLPHQDYLFWGPHILPGEVLGCWFALEDIDELACPLYVLTGSHLSLSNSIFEFSDISSISYRSSLAEHIRKNERTIVAPLLKAGDCLIWDSRLVHGALYSENPVLTRNSLTAHFGGFSLSHYLSSNSFRTITRRLKRLTVFLSSNKVETLCHSSHVFTNGQLRKFDY
jgi:phytanoyl-CoA hydroxylase